MSNETRTKLLSYNVLLNKMQVALENVYPHDVRYIRFGLYNTVLITQ